MERRLIVACVALLVAGSAFAAAPGVGPGAPNTEAAPATLATGTDSSVDGYLEIEVDEYGSWGDFGGVGLSDAFNPAGPEGLLPVAFTNGFFFFNSARGQQEVLTTIPDWIAVYLDNTDTSIAITSPNASADTNGDGVDDVTQSSFTISGGGTDLSVDLSQQISSLGGGAAQLVQTYSVTNNEAAPVTIEMVRNFDGDLIYDGDFGSDEVGTTSNAGGDTNVFMQEVGAPETSVTISGAAQSYYGGKLGILPGGTPPAYGFGTDVQIYDSLGLPSNWVNHIAGIGYDTDGMSGAQPSGCDIGTGCDAFIGLEFVVTIGAGATEDVVLTHTYGESGGGVPLDFNISGSCPGPTTLTASGGTPGGSVGIIFSNSPGSDPLGAGPCIGTPSGLEDPSLFVIQPLEADGSFSLDRNAGAGVCGVFLQLVDAEAGCALSNVTRVPLN